MRKSHKMILSLYIVLLMSLSMFCIHCKAYSNSGVVIHGGGSGQNSVGVSTVDWSITTSNERGCFFYIDDVDDAHSSTQNGYCDSLLIYVSKGSNDFVKSAPSQDIYIGWYGNAQYMPSVNTFLADKMSEYGYTNQGIWNISFMNVVEPNNYSCSWSVSDDVEYVDNYHDLYEYIYNNNDSVIKHGDPSNNEIVDQNGNIPTPQGVKLYNDGQCVGLVWDNPKMINKLVGKYGDVSVEIKFRPTLNYNLDLFRSKTLTPDDYIGGITSSLSDHGSLYNGFMTLFSNRSTVSNKLDKYNIKFDNHYIFTDNILDTDYANMVCKMLGHKLWYVPDSLLDAVLPARGGSLPANTLAGEMTDKKSKGVKAGEGGSAVDVGLKVLDSLGNLSDFASNVKELMNNVTVGHSDYMIRYYMMDGNKKLCSKWVNVNQTYDDNASATDEQSTNFKDVENNPVDNPNYNYPSSTSSSSSTGDSWWTHFDDSTKTVFDSLSEQMEQLTESDGGFMQFFGELFATFPWLAGIFMLALSIALFLRIFGR